MRMLFRFPLFLVLVLGVFLPARAEVEDPYWNIIRGGTAAQSETVQSASGNQALANTRNAYDLARGWNSSGQPLSIESVYAVNSALRLGISSPLAGAPGTLRTRGVVTPTNGGSERIVYTSSGNLPAEAAKLDAYLKDISGRQLSRADAIQAAADVHSFIVQNHMFGDANGRTARMMADTILMRNGLPPADYSAVPSSDYNQARDVPADVSAQRFRDVMDTAVTAAERRTGAAPAGTPGEMELLGVKEAGGASNVPELIGRNIKAKSFSPAVGVLTSAGLQVGGELVKQGLSGQGLHPGDAVASLASWQFIGGTSGFILAERVAASAIGAAIPIPGVGKLLGEPLAQAAIRGAAGVAGANLTQYAVDSSKPLDWKDLAGNSIASGVGMAVGQALIPIPVVGAVVGGVVGGLLWDAGYGAYKKATAPPVSASAGLPSLRGAPILPVNQRLGSH